MLHIFRKTGYGRYIPILFNLIDIVILNIAFFITLWMVPEIKDAGHHLRVIWFIANLCFLPLVWRNLQSQHTERVILMDNVFKQALTNVGIHALLYLSLLELMRIDIIPLKGYIAFYSIMAVGIVIWALVSRRMLKGYRRRGFNFSRVVIVGSNDIAERLYDEMLVDDGFGYKVLGVFDSKRPDNRLKDLYVGTLDELDAFVKARNVDQIFVSISGDENNFARAAKIADDNVTELYFVPQISKLVNRRFEIYSVGCMPVLSTLRNPLKSMPNRILKRAFDIIMSSICLCFYPLIYIPVAITIKLTSPGPVYFKQERTGYRGKSFQCLKFRSMHVNKDSDKAQATEHDPRKTKFGDFLRRSSIDELPQFINVWKGDMSIVGPRPHMLKHTDEYSRIISQYMVRHTVKPGITGWAQVNGFRGITDELWKMEKRVEHDVWYIEHWSFALDLKIIYRTIVNVFHGEKNAF
jgi:putative colanic acid biosynthesis UDP-glucose lipid carrier transferase